MSTRRCVHCGRRYRPTGARQQYCRDRCKQAARRVRLGRTEPVRVKRQAAAWPPLRELPPTTWQDKAACRGLDPEWWFPELPPGALGATHELAKAICSRCPVRGPCLEFAVETRQAFGIWGAATAEERAERARAAAEAGR